MTGLVLADTTIWSNFAHAGDPHLVIEAFPTVRSPPAVLDEIAEGRRLGYLGEFDWSPIAELRLSTAEKSRAGLLTASLGSGEAECIAVAESRGGLLLTDDRAARKLAASLGLAVSGTLGVLARLVDAGLAVEQADELLKSMVLAGYRCPVRSLREVL